MFHTHKKVYKNLNLLQKTGLKNIGKDYYSPFSHENELVKPGYHKLKLDRYGTIVELTSTRRVGFHRISFPDKKDNAVLLNLGGKLGPSDIVFGTIQKTGKSELRGMLVNGRTIRRPKDTPVFFAIQFSVPIQSMYSFAAKDVQRIEGNNEGAVLVLEESDGPVLMKVGISYVSSENAYQRALRGCLYYRCQ